jgi:hypothetical protein
MASADMMRTDSALELFIFRSVIRFCILGLLPLAGLALDKSAGAQAPIVRQSPADLVPIEQVRGLRTIGFMTDFELKDDAVGLCKAVMDGIAPGVQVIDITHQVTPYAVVKEQVFLPDIPFTSPTPQSW